MAKENLTAEFSNRVVFILLCFLVLPKIHFTSPFGEIPSCCPSCLLVSFTDRKLSSLFQVSHFLGYENY